MDQFLINIEKYRYAILGTILFHILIFVVSSFTSVQPVTKMPDEEIRMEIPLDDIEFEPEIEEILDLKKEPIPTENVSNLAADANDTRERDYENFSTNKDEIDQAVLDDAKELEAQFFKEAAANNPNHVNTQTQSNVDVETNATKKDKPKDNPTLSGGADNAFAGEVMISYNLKGRKAYALPNPGYTCNSSGTIVIQIKVDNSGDVKDIKFLSNLSSGASECLVERASNYAKKARFDFKSGGVQTGTITYKFMAR